jgi:carotenoid cleavage dioxygenase-like enzyme
MTTQTTAATKHDFRLGFEEPTEEIEVADLPVEGELPGWLAGSLVRVTPAKFEVGGKQLAHWFDGQAMLHAFSVGEGRVSYANRWLRTKQLESIERDGKLAYTEFATDPCRSIFKRMSLMFNPRAALTDNGVVNVVKLGDEHLALTETPLPVQFDPDTLATVGRVDWAEDIPGLLTTAHPHGNGGELVNYAAHIGPVSRYRFFTMPPGGRPRKAAEMKVREPAYVHSFGLTERFFILGEFPYVVDPLDVAKTMGRKPFMEHFRWEPDRGTRFHLFDRGTGELVRSFDAPAGFCFHHVNAYEDGSEVIVDACVYDDPSVIQQLYLKRILAGERGGPPPTLRRYRLDLETGSSSDEQLTEIPFELPVIDYGRRNTRPYRYTYGVSGSYEDDWFNVLAKVDVNDGSYDLWSEAGCYPSEPVFVRDPGSDEEDGGVALSVVLDTHSGRSFMLVLDARTWQEIARAEAPQHVPFGFHGQFFR